MTARVLVADDNDDCRASLRMLVGHLGCTVIEAKNGVEAIVKAVSTHPELIIMDLRMPKLGGLEALKRLKKIPSTRDIPIVMCSAMGREALGYASLIDHPFEFVQKPIRLQKIAEIVRRYVPQEKQQQASLTIEEKETINVIGARRLLQNIMHAINEDSFGVGLPEAHNFNQRPKDRAPTPTTKAADAIDAAVKANGGKLFAAFVQLLHGGIGCLDLLSMT